MSQTDMPPPTNLLLVDDRPANLLALEAILEPLGQKLIRASSGEEALRLAVDTDFAAILLDVQLPGLSGFETARRLRSRERSRHTPILFLTAHESADCPVIEAYRLGAVDYLIKPLVPDILRAKVAVFVDLFQKTEQIQRQAEQLRERTVLRFLAEASEVLAGSLDDEATLTSIAQLAVPHLADWCTVYLVEENGTVRRLEVAHVDPAKVEWVRDLERRYLSNPRAPRGIPHVLRTGQAQAVAEITDAMLVAAARDKEHLRILRSLGLRSYMAVPLIARGRTLGAMSFVTAQSGRCYGPDDLALAEDLARRAALAVDNARLFSEAEEAARFRAEALQQLSLLIEASAGLTSSLTLPAVLAAVLNLSHRLIAADAYAIWRLRSATGPWEIVSASGLSPSYLEKAGRVAVAGPVPQQPVVAEDVQQATQLEHRRAVYRAEGITSLLAVPLRIGGKVSGTLTFYYRTPQHFDDLSIRLATALANLAATAIGMAEFYAQQSELRSQAEQAHERLTFLSEASVALASSLDYQETLDRVVRLAVSRLADWCIVDVVEENGAIRQAAVAHADPAKVQLAWDLDRRYPDNPNAPRGVPEVIRTGQPELFADITDEVLRAIARDADHLQIIRRLGLRSGMIVPLPARGKVVGAISLGTAESGRRFGPNDLALAEELARRAALALDNARLYQQLRDAEQRKDLFLAMLAHELRNPLAPILNSLHVARQTGADSRTRAQALDTAERQTRHISRMVNDLLEATRITRGKVQVRPERTDLARLARTTAEDRRPLLEKAGLMLTVRTPETPVWIQGDPLRLAQVVNNLLDNAAKFTGRGGQVRVRLEAGGSCREAVLAVEDTGVGIEPTLLPRVFDVFTQADQSLARTRGGLGLGLAVVKGLIELHGGKVEADSPGPGRGAVFTVRLPCEEEPPALSASPTGSATPAKGIRVLIVEDNVDAARSLQTLLELLGHEVFLAHSGPDGVQLAAKRRPNVILCDIGLPGFDGFEVARQVRELPGMERVLLVALTGYSDEEMRRRSEEAGFHHHLVKPAEPEMLLRVLASGS